MKSFVPVVVVALFTPFLQVCPAPIGQFGKLIGKVGKGAVDAISDINDHVQNNSRSTIPFPVDGDDDANDNDLHGYIYSRGDEVDEDDDDDSDLIFPRGNANDPLAGMPEPALSICKKQMKSVTIKFHVKKNKGNNNSLVTIDSVPSACMTLANVFLGNNPGKPAPIPMGNASLKYENVSPQEIKELRQILGSK